MAEVLRALKPSEVGAYMPISELLTDQRREVYRAVGYELIMLYELNEDEWPSTGDFLVHVKDQILVGYSFGNPKKTADTFAEVV